MPPVIGLGLSTDWSPSLGATLLYSFNLLGIAAFVYVVDVFDRGIAPRYIKVRKALGWTLAFTAILSSLRQLC